MLEKRFFSENVAKLRLNRRLDAWIYDHRHHAPMLAKNIVLVCTVPNYSQPFSSSLSIILAIGIICSADLPHGLLFFLIFICLISPHDSASGGFLLGNLQT